jgi:hypothetical protein
MASAALRETATAAANSPSESAGPRQPFARKRAGRGALVQDARRPSRFLTGLVARRLRTPA